ncbi:hypothetical protein [Amycolatopsis echigonensis]|uniref:hypothetical protein n=1 Tax=Amycolatopsis echigonensis TaxID=2576905 RepID=UPI001304A784|nr:hypothetical protein [Amycolatopsis niigatensis]
MCFGVAEISGHDAVEDHVPGVRSRCDSLLGSGAGVLEDRRPDVEAEFDAVVGFATEHHLPRRAAEVVVGDEFGQFYPPVHLL